MARVRGAPAKSRVPKGTLRDQILSVVERDDALKKALHLLRSELDSNAAVALLFDEPNHALQLTEQVGLSAKQRRGLGVILESVAPRVPAKDSGIVLIFTEAEAHKSGISSAFVYHLVRGKRLVGAVIF